MKFLIDMNLSPRWVEVLSAAGYEACHWSQIGNADAPDSVVLTWAAETSSVLVTADLDFPAILASTQGERPSVLLIRSDNLSPANLKSAVLQTIRIAREELEAGAIVSIDPSRSRIRLLPLGR